MSFNVAILGASGAVGKIMLDIIYQRNFPYNKVYPLSSKRSSGKDIRFGENNLKLIDVEKFDFSKAKIALFSAGSEVSKKWAPIAAEKGCVVIDNTSCFRMEKSIPLIVPEINAQSLKDYKNINIISNPNCSTIQMLLALKPLHDLVPIKRVVVSTYQSVSGAGKDSIDELYEQNKNILKGKDIIENKFFPTQIAYNVIPHIDKFLVNGTTKEEQKMIDETRKILDSSIKVSATCVRVPTIIGHAESINVEFKHAFDIKTIKGALKGAKGIKFLDGQKYITPKDSEGKDWVYVSRLRLDSSLDNTINMWVVSDNLRKGAALNSVQIAESLIKNKLI